MQRRDSNPHMVTEKGKEKIRVELMIDGKVLTDKDSERMKDHFMRGIKEITRDFGKKALFGTYRGFDVSILRSSQLGGGDGFRFALKGAGDQEFQPNNLIYSFEDKFSLTGLFQRLDNFLAKGLDEAMETYRDNAQREAAELDTVNAALGKDFPQKDELTLVRENHGGIIRELQRMQDEPNYVSVWKPKTALAADQPMQMAARQVMRYG